MFKIEGSPGVSGGRISAGSPLDDDAFQPPTAGLHDLVSDPNRVLETAAVDSWSEKPFDVEADLKAHHRIPNLIIGLVLIASIIAGFVMLYFGGLKLFSKLQGPEDYPGPGNVEIIITIPAGADVEHIAQLLLDEDVIKSAEAFIKAATAHPSYFADIQAADYKVRTRMRAEDALKILGDPGNVVQAFFTIPEGFSNARTFERIHETTGIPVDELELLAVDPGELELPEWANGVTEGYLAPNTYAYDATPTALEALKPMVDEFKRLIEELEFVAAAEALGVSPADAVNMAGLVEREGGTLQYAADIAGVFYNRLKIGMPLQSDATISYALNDYTILNLTEEMLAIDSPYNTYLHPGLPPTAISNPGRISLLAAVHPTEHDYLYFVATNPTLGTVKFARTLEEHEANVAEFNVWCDANPVECGTA
ncbi:MAG: endolytic transglycosylase MltG [Propionibacteriaceae bacterium]|jgi:UPF0755 protein|nr:endolytic transglycosylase MltG [Propionibacteriaceae bacterium]